MDNNRRTTKTPRPAELGDSKPRHTHRHHRSRRKSGHLRTLQLTNFILALALVGVFIGWINTWVNLNRSEQELFTHAAELRQLHAEIDLLRSRDKELNDTLNDLVEKRLPSLRRLVFDSTLPIDNDYVRNISFTRTGIGAKIRYEYSLVLANQSNDTLRPNVRVLLFDEAGIQTAAAKITPSAATSNSDLEFLEPREVRAYTAKLEIDRLGVEPRYFQVYVR